MSGSITRSTLNTAEGAISVYFMVEDTLPDGSSITFFKTPPGADTPLDIRLRTKGIIDIKMQDGTIADSSDFTWKKQQWYRCDLVWTWDAVSGLMDANVFLYLKGNGEYAGADDILHATGVTTSPTNYTHGSPSSSNKVRFEVERSWASKVIPGPYGTPPPAPPLDPATTLIRPGVCTPTTAMVSVYTGDAGLFDVVDLNTSTNSGMTSATTHSGAVHNEGGFNVFTVTGLTAATTYYTQAVVNGTPQGPVTALRTTHTVGTPCTIRRAVGGCQISPPASLAAFTDMTGANDSWVADRLVHLGDDGYYATLTPDPFSHWQTYASSMSDDWSQMLATAGIPINKVISDHDVNGDGQSNNPNFNDPTTIASLIAWAAAVPAPMEDVRDPKHGRYYSEIEGNVRFVYLDQRNIDRTDVRQKKAIPPDDPDSWMIDTDQESWLYAHAAAAAAAGQLLIIYTDSAFLGVSPYDPTSGIPTSYSDKWPSYTVQRDRIDETLASIMPISDGHPNVEIWHSDSHALQFGVSPMGIKVRCCGPLHQELHAHYQPFYDLTYPPNTKGEGGGTNTARRQQYMRQTIVESPAGTWTVTADMRQCSPKVIGDTPTTPHTDTTVYYASGHSGGGAPVHLYSMVGVPT